MPVVRVFNLQSNRHVFVAANSIKPYVYDDTIWNKLVLPENDLDFIHMLLSSTSVNISDIVHGKAKGIIVLCSGGPGLGKTLTAEASSEAFKKPFYSVQCSQLGIDPESLEKSLLKVLVRASRWEAILLLDEADVYVRRRSIDIQQNAIVGVFLRVLEYYRGVMFMTTNLGNDIDDAILSRATAHLQYELPEKEALPKLWRVLADQMQVNITDDDIEQLIEKFGQLPGRSIRNLLKLSRYWVVSKKIKASAAVVIKVAQYLNVEHLTEKAVSKKLS
jgi:AAA+ superfamily predicted ATPase